MQQKYMDLDDPHTLCEKIKSEYVTKIKKNAFTIWKELYGICLEDAGSIEVYAQRIQQAIDQFNLIAGGGIRSKWGNATILPPVSDFT